MILNPTLWQIIEDYFRITIAYWWFLVPGVLMPLPEIYKLLHPHGRHLYVPRWIRWTALFCICLAQFLAYRNEALNLANVIEEKRQFSIANNSIHAQLQSEVARGDQLEGQLAACPKKPQTSTRLMSVQNPRDSIVNQESPNFGTQTIITTPSRVLPGDKAAQLTTNAAQIKPVQTFIYPAGTSDDVQPVLGQLCKALASWGPNCQGVTGMMTGIEFPDVQGIQCFSESWDSGTPALLKSAFERAGFKCSYISRPFAVRTREEEQ